MEIYAPDGDVGRPIPTRADAPGVLSGARVGVLDNGKPNARLLLTRAAEQLAARTGATIELVTGKGTDHNAATPCSDEVLERLAKEVDLVLTGSAD